MPRCRKPGNGFLDLFNLVITRFVSIIMKKKQMRPFMLPKKVFLGAALFLLSTGMLQAAADPAFDPARTVAGTGQQQKTIQGVVTDAAGEPIIGANVVVKGTANGTITDIDGRFTLQVPSGALIQVSYIGYLNSEVKVGAQSSYTIRLKENTQALDEVVVVGYGTQKKVNLSGAIASVNVSELTESRPITNISSALSGAAAGVNVVATNNRPSNNGDAAITVRGEGTLNNSSPLVIVDGVESNINNVNPQDVETITVLKDAASAAIYGSRASNGVILITTKTGKEGKMKLEYNGYVSFETLDQPYEVISNYADYMTYLNEGLRNSGKPEQFSQNVIDLWRSNESNPNSLLYPNSDIFDVYKTGVSQRHTVSATGGSDKVTFYASFNYLNNPGILENTGYQRYDLRTNVEAKLKSWLKVGVNLSGYTAKTTAASDNIDDTYTYGLTGGNPGIAYKDAQGRLGVNPNNEDDPQNATNNPYVRLRNVSGDIKFNNLKARLNAVLTPVKGLTIQGSYAYEYYDKFKDSKPVFVELWNFLTETLYSDGKGRTSIYNYNEKRFRHFMDGTIGYEHTFFNDRLNANLMIGGSQEQFRRQYFNATRYDLLDPSLNVIGGAIGESSSGGNTTEWAMRSFFGRLNLAWDNKYLFEANLRADGSSRFLQNNRWGYFPSFSAAWRISEEAFMKNIAWLDNLKVRLSYGSLGNNSLGSDKDLDGNYSAQSLYSQTNYVLARAVEMGLSQTAIANAALTWETTYVTNGGLDFTVLNNRLSGTIDGFYKKTKDILISLPAPMVHGNASIPKQNAAEVSNRGVEITMNWNDRAGKDFRYNAGFNFTYIKNKVDKFRGDVKSISGATMLLEGMPMNVAYVRRVDRLVQTDADLALVQQMLDNAPLDENGKKRTVFPYGVPEKGDFLYKDLNGDGVVDDDDREAIGSGSTPKFTYGINLGFSWKGIDFSTLLQGVAGVKDIYNSNLYRSTVRVGYQLNKEVIEGRWYEGRTTAAAYPRLLEYSITKNEQYSDFWLASKAYLKIRNIQLGYTLPAGWTQAVSIEKVRIYGSLENFFTFTKWKGYDPEIKGVTYPTMRQAVIGLNVAF